MAIISNKAYHNINNDNAKYHYVRYSRFYTTSENGIHRDVLPDGTVVVDRDSADRVDPTIGKTVSGQRASKKCKKCCVLK